MSTLTRINSKTWVTTKSKNSLDDYRKRLNTYSVIGVSSKGVDKLPRTVISSRTKDYILFLKEVFKDRTFISEKDFNFLLKQEFGNSTWYRKRLINMGYISLKNGNIKPITSNITENPL